MNKYIGVIDSGVGGLTVLKKCRELLYYENFVYLADTFNAPYGNKTSAEIYLCVKKCVYYLIENYNIKALVIACNTATVCCIKKLREEFNIPIVGAEPPLKVVFRKNKSNKFMVLSTVATNKFSGLIRYYRRDKKIVFLPQKHWAKLIDDNIFNLQNIKHKFYLKKLSRDIKYVVLGCTHYVFIKKLLKQIYTDKIFLDSGTYIASRLKLILQENIILKNYGYSNLKLLSTTNYCPDKKLMKVYKTKY